MGELILTRKPGESVKIGDSLVLTVREVHPAKVYVHFTNATARWFALGESWSLDPMQLPNANVTIAAIGKGVVRLLFEADRSVAIVRTELL